MHEMVVNVAVDPCDVYVGRGTKWGNPYKAKDVGGKHQAILMYSEYLNKRDMLPSIRRELKGKKLGCHCAPGICHADILAAIANDPDFSYLD